MYPPPPSPYSEFSITSHDDRQPFLSYTHTPSHRRGCSDKGAAALHFIASLCRGPSLIMASSHNTATTTPHTVRAFVARSRSAQRLTIIVRRPDDERRRRRRLPELLQRRRRRLRHHNRECVQINRQWAVLEAEAAREESYSTIHTTTTARACVNFELHTKSEFEP